MKMRFIVPVLFLLGMLSASAEVRTRQAAVKSAAEESRSQSSAAGTDATNPPKIDPAKESAIRKLMEVTGGTDMLNQVMEGTANNMKPLMTNALPPGAYRAQLIDLFFQKFQSKADVRQLMDQAVLVYDKYLSLEDVNGLIQFYSTPLGQKTLSVLPKLTVEMQGIGIKWGQDIGRQSMVEVLAEHPDLAQALQDAAKNSKPQQ